ncbi:MAG TPA: hypothetical protein PKW33_14000 [Anaerolineaceae bacterium]|nr:hypothetical protein [Anaerolineaceae bacterium]HPN52701.1 hypothetical protein [Anaerolineaceae bacterium]
MNEYTRQPLPPILSPSPEELHRKQVFWQVWVPLIVTLVILVAAMSAVVASAVVGTGDVGRWQAISLIFLIMPAMVGGLLLLALLGLFCYAIFWLLKNLPAYAHLAQAYLHYFSVLVRHYADKAATPVLLVRIRQAEWQAFWRGLRAMFNRQP